MDCIFCKIANKEIQAFVVHENEHAFAVLDITPRAPGHTMVIPKVHAENIIELPDEEIGHLFKTVKEVTAHLDEVLGPDGFTIGINHGDASGQTVKHLHIHVIPRFKEDKGGSIHSVVNNPPEEELSSFAERLKF